VFLFAVIVVIVVAVIVVAVAAAAIYLKALHLSKTAAPPQVMNLRVLAALLTN
jgi:hypothetical protein